MTAYNVLQCLVVGSVGGMMGGFFGVGAGILMIPLLIFWLLPAVHVPPAVLVQVAFGTSLAIVIPTALLDRSRTRRRATSRDGSSGSWPSRAWPARILGRG